MRYIIFFLFLSVGGFAQTLVSDTSYIVQKDGRFFMFSQYEYADGGVNTVQVLIGDSTALYLSYKSRFENEARQMAFNVAQTSNFDRSIKNLLRESEQVELLIGANPIDTLRTSKEATGFFTDAAKWTITGDTSQSISFNYSNAGKLRYKINSGANRNADVIGIQVLRLNDYPAPGKTTDFFLSGKKYITQDGKLKITRL